MATIVIIGPAHPLRGGLATFNQRLAKEFIDQGHNCSLYSFSLQYPSFLFPGKSQFTKDKAPTGLRIFPIINSINPFNWIKVGNRLRKEKPDIIVVRYWLPFMGPALGTILRCAKKNKHSRVVCIADNIIPHEKRIGDQSFTRYFIKSPDAFITMSEKVLKDLRKFEQSKPAELTEHPLYDNFGSIISKKEARQHLGLTEQDRIILFFGFIRKYKGLDILLEAMNQPGIREKNIKLLVAGEFYEDEKPYQRQIETLGIQDLIILRTDFIPDSEVKYYLSAADLLVQPYRNATQSGVTPLAYHFETPMLVTRTGGLPDLVPEGKVGLVVEPNPVAVAEGILRFYQTGESHFIGHLKEEKKRFSWAKFTAIIFNLANKAAK